MSNRNNKEKDRSGKRNICLSVKALGIWLNKVNENVTLELLNNQYYLMFGGVKCIGPLKTIANTYIKVKTLLKLHNEHNYCNIADGDRACVGHLLMKYAMMVTIPNKDKTVGDVLMDLYSTNLVRSVEHYDLTSDPFGNPVELYKFFSPDRSISIMVPFSGIGLSATISPHRYAEVLLMNKNSCDIVVRILMHLWSD